MVIHWDVHEPCPAGRMAQHRSPRSGKHGTPSTNFTRDDRVVPLSAARSASDSLSSVPASSIGLQVARFRCASSPTKPHAFTPDLTTPTDVGSRGTGHGQYFRSRVAAVNPVGVCVEATAPTPREAATSRKAGYRDHTFHQERDLLPSRRHRRRRDGAHLLRSRLPHTSDVGRSAKPARPRVNHRAIGRRRDNILPDATFPMAVSADGGLGVGSPDPLAIPADDLRRNGAWLSSGHAAALTTGLSQRKTPTASPPGTEGATAGVAGGP
jgi:hypothetical protein